jgi:hypothetical protein
MKLQKQNIYVTDGRSSRGSGRHFFNGHLNGKNGKSQTEPAAEKSTIQEVKNAKSYEQFYNCNLQL